MYGFAVSAQSADDTCHVHRSHSTRHQLVVLTSSSLGHGKFIIELKLRMLLSLIMYQIKEMLQVENIILYSFFPC